MAQSNEERMEYLLTKARQNNGLLMEKEMLEFRKLASKLGKRYRIQRYDLGMWSGSDTTLDSLKSGEETCT